MTPRRKLPPEVERAIVADYARGELSVKAIAVRRNVSAWTVNLVRRRHGLRRYQTHAEPTTPRLRAATLRHEATPLLWRCPGCGGRATAPEGHASCHPNTEAA